MKGGYKILMLENDISFTNKVRLQLRRRKIDVDVAIDENKAEELLLKQKYDLLTIDFVLKSEEHRNKAFVESEKNLRKKFITKLRQEKRLLIPIIVISAHRESLPELLNVGANSYINKSDIKENAKKIKEEINNSVPTLSKLYSSLENEQKTENEKKIEVLKKIITAYERINLSPYALPYREKRKQYQYQTLLQKKLTIDEIKITNLVCFKDIDWKPQTNINILLGRNGYGKTFLSRILLALMCDHKYALEFFDIDTKLHRNTDIQNIRAKVRIIRDKENAPIIIKQSKAFFDYYTPKIPILAIPDVRTFDRARKQLPTDIQEDILDNSASAYIQKRPFNNTILYLLNLLCGYWRDSKIEGSEKHPIFTLLEEVYHELIGDKTFKFVDKESKREDGIVGEEIKKIKKENNIYVESSFTNGEKIRLQDASQGTLSVMVIFGLIYEYLEQKNKVVSRDASKTHGIVFIDEIDSHLHPSWQQKIVPLLKNQFEKVQFFLNSHSPLIVTGCVRGEVSILQKVDNSISLYQYNNQDFIGILTTDLLEHKGVFGIEDKDAEYQKYAVKWLYEDKESLKQKYLQAKKDPKQKKTDIESLKNDYLNMQSFEEQLQVREARFITKQLTEENRQLRKRIQELEKEKN